MHSCIYIRVDINIYVYIYRVHTHTHIYRYNNGRLLVFNRGEHDSEVTQRQRYTELKKKMKRYLLDWEDKVSCGIELQWCVIVQRWRRRCVCMCRVDYVLLCMYMCR